MNYQNLENEVKKYSDFFRGSQSTLLKIATYYKEVGKIGGKFAERMKKLMDEFYIELMKEDRSNTFNKFLSNLYTEKIRFIKKIQSYFLLLEKNYGERLADFERDYRNKNKDIISKLNKMISNLAECKNQEDKWKNQYFDICKTILETEKKIKNLEENEKNGGGSGAGKGGDTTEVLNKLKLLLTKNKEIKDLRKKNYKEEQMKLNRLLEASENNYNNIVNTIEKEVTNRMKYLQNAFKEINQANSNFINDFTESTKKIETMQVDINIKRDIRYFKQDYDFFIKIDNSKTNKRFILEEFLDYDYILTKHDNTGNKNNKADNSLNIITNKNKDIDEDEYDRAKFILELGQQCIVDFSTLNNKGKEINDIINNLLNQENIIQINDVLTIINYIENNRDNCKNFMELLVLHYCQNEFTIIKNEQNFYNLIKILSIILNFAFDNKEIFDICFLIIFVAEKTIYISTDNSEKIISLAKNISGQNVLHSINFWKDLINAKIGLVAKVDIRKEFEKRRKNINNNNNGFFGKLFKGGKKEEIVNIENEILQNQLINENAIKYFTIVFYDFLKLFSKFNFTNADKLLNSFTSTKFKLDQKTIDLFNNIIKSNNVYKLEKEKIMNEKNTEDEQILFNFKSNKKFKSITDKSLKSILFSLKYLDKSDYTSILFLNKTFHKKMLKLIHKSFFLNKEQNKKLEIKKHLEIWKIILKYENVKKEYDYQKIKESNEDPNKKIIGADIIDLDILRTYLRGDKEENKKKLKNILKAISSELPSLNYYQGMNQIAAFLLSICENEDEAFYLFMSILKNTNYSILYENDLEKMNCFFYQFERLLNLYIPEIYLLFKVSLINAGYFISPWFITLFTSAFIDIENKNNAKSIMHLWDLFILDGWKEIMKVGLILLKKKEKFMMEKLSETLLQFLTGDILKSEILDNEHFDELVDLCNNKEFKIPNKLLKDFENEYYLKKSIEFFNKDNKMNTY